MTNTGSLNGGIALGESGSSDYTNPMASLRPNLVKRIERLPKPMSVAAAMQPLFEAISNSIHSVQAKFGEAAIGEGRVVVTVKTNRKKESVWATVEDNGLGLDARNWDAFTTTDTDNKLSIGGKGVGRLLWLDFFERVHINTVFLRTIDLSGVHSILRWPTTSK